jgi:hypothetical protein
MSSMKLDQELISVYMSLSPWDSPRQNIRWLIKTRYYSFYIGLHPGTRRWLVSESLPSQDTAKPSRWPVSQSNIVSVSVASCSATRPKVGERPRGSVSTSPLHQSPSTYRKKSNKSFQQPDKPHALNPKMNEWHPVKE